MVATGAMQIVSPAAMSRFTRFVSPARKRFFSTAAAVAQSASVPSLRATEYSARSSRPSTSMCSNRAGPLTRTRALLPAMWADAWTSWPPACAGRDGGAAGGGRQRDGKNRELNGLNCPKHFTSPFSGGFKGKRRARRKIRAERDVALAACRPTGQLVCGVGQIVRYPGGRGPGSVDRRTVGRVKSGGARTGAHRLIGVIPQAAGCAVARAFASRASTERGPSRR